MTQIKFNFNNFARVCHSLATCQRHTPSSLAAVIGLSNNDVISLRSLRCVRCVGWKPRFTLSHTLQCFNRANINVRKVHFILLHFTLNESRIIRKIIFSESENVARMPAYLNESFDAHCDVIAFLSNEECALEQNHVTLGLRAKHSQFVLNSKHRR